MKRPIIEQQVTFLATADLEANAAFYEDLLGLPLILDQVVCRIYALAAARRRRRGKEPVMNATYNIYHFFMRDPDGYLVEIQRFLDPNWPTL